MKSFQMFFLAMIFTMVKILKGNVIRRVYLESTGKLFNVVSTFYRQKLSKIVFRLTEQMLPKTRGLRFYCHPSVHCGLFRLPDSVSDLDSDSNCKPCGYIVLCRMCSTDSDSDLDPFPK